VLLQVIIARKKNNSGGKAVFCVGAFMVPNANSVSSKVSADDALYGDVIYILLCVDSSVQLHCTIGPAGGHWYVALTLTKFLIIVSTQWVTAPGRVI
jgi:hypothetical protein